MKSKNNNTLKIVSITVISISLLTKVLSFLRDLMVTAVLGAGSESDAYNIGYLLTISIFGFIGSAYSNSMMSVASGLFIKDKNSLEKTVNNILSLSILLALFVVFLFWLFPAFFVNILASGVSVETYSLALKVSKIGIISLLFLVLSSTFGIVLRIYDRNIVPSIGELLFPIPSLIGLIMGIDSIDILIILLVIGYMLQALIQFIFLKKEHFKFHFYINYRDEYLLKMLSLMPPMLLSTGLLQINTIIDNRTASGYGSGSITSLSLASKINGLAYTVFAASLMQIIYSSLSKAFAQNNRKELQKILTQQTSSIIMLVLPSAICMMVFNNEIVNLLFVRGNFTEEAGKVTAEILMGYSVGLVFSVLRDICNYLFYASQNVKLPAMISGIAVIINIILNLTLPKLIGIQGVSYATSIAGACSCVILLFYMKKIMPDITLIYLRDVVSLVVSGILMASIMISLKAVYTDDMLFLIIIMGVGIIVFFLCNYFVSYVIKKIG